MVRLLQKLARPIDTIAGSTERMRVKVNSKIADPRKPQKAMARPGTRVATRPVAIEPKLPNSRGGAAKAESKTATIDHYNFGIAAFHADASSATSAVPSRALIPLDCSQEKVYCLAVPWRQSIVLV